MIKLICIDVDGTLVYGDTYEIPKVNLEAVSHAIKKGVAVSIVSGRIYQSAKDYMDRLGAKGPVSSFGGCLLEDTDGSILEEFSISKDAALKINRAAVDFGITMILYSRHSWYADSNADKKWLDAEVIATGVNGVIVDNAEDVIKSNIVSKFLAINDNPSVVDRFCQYLNSNFSKEVNAFKSFDCFLEVVPPKANKGQAVRALKKYYNLDSSEVMAIGDFDNDIPMMRECVTSVAVANACENLKKTASYITKNDNVHGAVAEAIEHFVL